MRKAPRDSSSSRIGPSSVEGVMETNDFLVALLVLSLAGLACKSSPAHAPTTGALCTAAAPGPAPLRRLTRFEIGRSLSDVLGVDPALADMLPPDEQSDGYDNASSAYSVSALHAAK